LALNLFFKGLIGVLPITCIEVVEVKE
jgi:hypothetical protein